MRQYGHFDPRSGEFMDPSVTGNPCLASFGLTELAVPLLIGALGSAGIGATTAGTIASIAAPAMISAGVGAAGSAAFGGDPGRGALFGGIVGGAGPLVGALSRGFSAPVGGFPGMGGATTGALNSAAGMGESNGGGDFIGTSAAGEANGGGDFIGTGGSVGQTPQSPLAQVAASHGSNTNSTLGLLAGLLQAGMYRAPTTAPQGATMNSPLDPGAYLNRTPVSNPGTPSSYYTYGQRPPTQFYSGNQFHVPGMANGGALSRAMVQRRMAEGGEFSTGGGSNFVQGGGDGQSDSIPARLSAGEYVLTAADVSRIGQGSTDAGVKKLDEMRGQIAHDAGAERFQPKVKSPLSYLQRAA